MYRFMYLQDFMQKVFKVKEKDTTDTINTKESEKSYMDVKSCCFCEKPFQVKRNKHIKGHCHGKCRGAAHTHCDQKGKRNYSSFTTIILHIMNKYD